MTKTTINVLITFTQATFLHKALQNISSMKTTNTQTILFDKCDKCVIITSHCFLARSYINKVNTLTHVLVMVYTE